MTVLFLFCLCSGLAVQPNPSSSNPANSIFARAETSSEPGTESRRRIITMYQSGFVVDDGPYRRLNDPENREFLTSLAQGRVPRELATTDENGNQVAVEVGLVDKRKEEYVEPPPTFASFSGAGESLGTAESESDDLGGVFIPDDVTTPIPPAEGEGSTSVQIRLLTGKRIVIKILRSETVRELGQRLNASGMAGTDPYVLVAGYPPKPLRDLSLTVQSAGLAGASIQQKKS